jgi:hypothetical protein
MKTFRLPLSLLCSRVALIFVSLIAPARASITGWPSYLAQDYKDHRTPLTKSQIAMIRSALAQVKPCQRAFLRYAFPKHGAGLDFVLFFLGPPYAFPHVFWTNNLYYKPNLGEAFPGPSGVAPVQWNGLKWDIDHTGCVPGTSYSSPIPP